MGFINQGDQEKLGTAEDQHRGASDREVTLLAQLAQLTDWVDQATSAICGNNLGTFEELLKHQQLLCAELTDTLRSVIDKGESQRLLSDVHSEVKRAANRNREFLLLLERVALHAQSLLRLYRAHSEEHWDTETASVRSMEGRYV